MNKTLFLLYCLVMLLIPNFLFANQLINKNFLTIKKNNIKSNHLLWTMLYPEKFSISLFSDDPKIRNARIMGITGSVIFSLGIASSFTGISMIGTGILMPFSFSSVSIIPDKILSIADLIASGFISLSIGIVLVSAGLPIMIIGYSLVSFYKKLNMIVETDIKGQTHITRAAIMIKI